MGSQKHINKIFTISLIILMVLLLFISPSTSLNKLPENQENQGITNPVGNSSIVSVDKDSLEFSYNNNSDDLVTSVDLEINVTYFETHEYILFLALVDPDQSFGQFLTQGSTGGRITEIEQNQSTIGNTSISTNLDGSRFFPSHTRNNVTLYLVWVWDAFTEDYFIEWSEPLSEIEFDYQDFIQPQIVMHPDDFEVSFYNLEGAKINDSLSNIAVIGLSFNYSLNSDFEFLVRSTAGFLGEVSETPDDAELVVLDPNDEVSTGQVSKIGNYSNTSYFTLSETLKNVTNYKLSFSIYYSYSHENSLKDMTYGFTFDKQLNSTNFDNYLSSSFTFNPTYILDENDKLEWIDFVFDYNSTNFDLQHFKIESLDHQTIIRDFNTDNLEDDIIRLPIFHPLINISTDRILIVASFSSSINNETFRSSFTYEMTIDLSNYSLVNNLVQDPYISAEGSYVEEYSEGDPYDLLTLTFLPHVNFQPGNVLLFEIQFGYRMRSTEFRTSYYLFSLNGIDLTYESAAQSSIIGGVLHDRNSYPVETDPSDLAIYVFMTCFIEFEDFSILEYTYEVTSNFTVSDFNAEYSGLDQIATSGPVTSSPITSEITTSEIPNQEEETTDPFDINVVGIMPINVVVTSIFVFTIMKRKKSS